MMSSRAAAVSRLSLQCHRRPPRSPLPLTVPAATGRRRRVLGRARAVSRGGRPMAAARGNRDVWWGRAGRAWCRRGRLATSCHRGRSPRLEVLCYGGCSWKCRCRECRQVGGFGNHSASCRIHGVVQHSAFLTGCVAPLDRAIVEGNPFRLRMAIHRAGFSLRC